MLADVDATRELIWEHVEILSSGPGRLSCRKPDIRGARRGEGAEARGGTQREERSW